jgi:ribosomal-protein-alanine N-acetyltransferase
MMMSLDWRPPVLNTPRLTLRPFVEADAEPLFVHARNPNVTRFTLWDHHKTSAETVTFVRDYALARYREGMADPYAITLTPDLANPVGACGCFWTSQPNKVMELGYWIAEPYWGRGLAVEASRAVLDFAFRELKPERMQARVIAGNDPSRRVLEKLRFWYEGTLRQVLLRRGNQEDVMLYSLLRTEWHEAAEQPV